MERLGDDPDLFYLPAKQSAPGAAPPFIVRLWPDPRLGPLRLRIWFGTPEGRPGVVGIELWGVPPITDPDSWLALADWLEAMGMTADDLPESAIRAQDVRLPLGAFLDAHVEMQQAFARAARHLGAPAKAVEKYERRLGTRRQGRPALSDEMLREVTAIYNQAVRAGYRDPAVRVFEKLGKTFGASVPDTARGWVRNARKRWPDEVARAPQKRRTK